MAYRDRGSSGSYRTQKTRQSRRNSSSTILWLEIAGAVLLGIFLIAFFSGGKSQAPPRTDPTPAQVPQRPSAVPSIPAAPRLDRAAKPEPPARVARDTKQSRPTVPPARPAPKADLTEGRELFKRVQVLWNEHLKLREKGKMAEVQDTLYEGYVLIKQALDTVDEFNLWDEEADLQNWERDAETWAAKREIGAWFNLFSRIHKVLPKRTP